MMFSSTGHCWPKWRTLSFLTGIALLALASSPPLVAAAHTDINAHMTQHLLVGMFAPIFLVIGTPVTLLLVSLPPPVSRKITGLFKGGFFQAIIHPGTALLLNIGSMYLLYLTPLYARSLTHPVIHHLIHLHFFIAGYLFTWSLIAPDAVPGRAGVTLRGGILFSGIAAHAFLAKYMYAYAYPHGTPFSQTAIRDAAMSMFYWGDLAELILAAFFFRNTILPPGAKRGTGASIY